MTGYYQRVIISKLAQAFGLILVLACGVVSAQSNLPECSGTDISLWTNCHGTSDFVTGHKYVGEWQEGKPNGQGTFIYLDGRRQYVGQFRDGKFSGKGTYKDYWEVYVGEFRDGRFHGQGTQTNTLTGVSRSGTWRDDNFVVGHTSRHVDGRSASKAEQFSRTSEDLGNNPVVSQQSSLDLARKKCEELGLKSGTEKFGECVLRLSR